MRRWHILLAAALLVVLLGSSHAEARRYASIVVDARTGAVLHADQPDRWVYPASLTKMMTLYMAFDALDRGALGLDTQLRTSAHAASMPPSELGLRAGDRIRAGDVIKSLVTKSANDAAVVLAEAIGGSEAEFARMMTRRARDMGLTATTFRNASGLPDAGQRTTARDMARLALRLQQDFPHRYALFSTTSFHYAGRTYRNHNRLLETYSGTDGIKTGYIRASGFNLVASVERDGRRLVGVVIGGRTSASRNSHMIELLDAGFRTAEHRSARWEIAAAPRRPADVTVASMRDALPASSADALAPLRRPASGTARAASSSEAGAPLRVRVEPPADRVPSLNVSFGVEVGAFASPEDAQAAAAAVTAIAPPLLADATVEIASINDAAGTLYRARRMGLSQQAATAICRALGSVGQSCDVVRRSGFDTRVVAVDAS